MKKGFTLLEVLIAMFILVIVFGLVTFLYVKAASIRKIVVANSEIQQTLSQMMDTIIHGEKGKWGLADATTIRAIYDDKTYPDTAISQYTLVAYKATDETTGDTMIVRIASEEELLGSGDTTKTLWVNWYESPSPPLSSSFYTDKSLIDINKKIELTNNSCFSYYDSGGRNIVDDGLNTETTLVKITLEAKSTEPALSEKAPVTLKTAIRLRNALPF